MLCQDGARGGKGSVELEEAFAPWDARPSHPKPPQSLTPRQSSPLVLRRWEAGRPQRAQRTARQPTPQRAAAGVGPVFSPSRSSVAFLGERRETTHETATDLRPRFTAGVRARKDFAAGDDLLLGAEAEAPAVRSEGPRDRRQFPHGDGWRALQPVAKRSPHPHPPHGLWAPEDRARGRLVARWVRGVRVRPAGDGHARVREPEAVRVDLFQILKGRKRLRRADRVGLR